MPRPPDVAVSARPPRRRDVVAPERDALTGRARSAFDRADKNRRDDVRPRRVPRPRGRLLVGAGAGLAAIAATIAVVAVASGRGNDGPEAATSITSGVGSTAPDGPNDAAAPASTAAPVSTAAVSAIPPGAIVGFDAALELTAFDEVVSPMLGPQRASIPDSMDLDVVCGPTKCLLPQFIVVDPILFDVDTPTVSIRTTRVDRDTGNGIVCTWVSDQTYDFTRQADGSFTGSITTTSRRLVFATTGGQCYALNASWDVTFTPRRA